MPLEGDYEPSTEPRVAEQVAEYERSGGQRAATLPNSDQRIIIVTTRGHRSGKIRKFALIRVEQDGEYALVASNDGADSHPSWYYNILADPTALMIQDGPEPFDAEAREVTGDEKAAWWTRAATVFPRYDEYQRGARRDIPLLVARRIS